VIDLHMHLLPGLDDGPSGMEEALAMCRLARARGMTAIAATPHMFNGLFEVSREDILRGTAALRRRLAEERIDLEVVPGADTHLHPDLIRFIEDGRVMTLCDGGRYLLLELPSGVVPHGLERFLFSIRLAGVTPIITHPERNLEIQAAPERMEKTVSCGALLQVTAGSFTGAFGARAQRCAFKLMESGMAHLAASDAHSPVRRPPGLEEARRIVERFAGPAEADEIFLRRPAAIIAGDTVDVPAPGGKKRIGFFRKLRMRGFRRNESREYA
jgi:protein-tyrosine phosphatase